MEDAIHRFLDWCMDPEDRDEKIILALGICVLIWVLADN